MPSFKCTTTGVELIAKPKLLLFLDAPTSGLDSQSVCAIMKFLCKLHVVSAKVYLLAIELASINILESWSRSLTNSCSSKKAARLYFGDIGEGSSTMLECFEHNSSPRCNPNANLAEYMFDVIGEVQQHRP
ncbi:uncharacterized protein HD556DRAFT_1231410 [Suillus plorans]|uniref:Uncharacterized protein n=1 Tax=Suillus plorans TaxID=116603 RepID=A0A9P7DNN6_9AGAM|nr:uncharacterized protein HD556DRAFT_1231410 [Suillus plorans]KAG1799239.1 hypothetical protein HD556DRAFT_1231410 [Suillus plorans]